MCSGVPPLAQCDQILHAYKSLEQLVPRDSRLKQSCLGSSFRSKEAFRPNLTHREHLGAILDPVRAKFRKFS